MSLPEEYMRLVERIEDVLEDADMDNIVPALATFLAQAGWRTKAKKRPFVAYVVGVIDRVYESCEKDQENRRKQ